MRLTLPKALALALLASLIPHMDRSAHPERSAEAKRGGQDDRPAPPAPGGKQA